MKRLAYSIVVILAVCSCTKEMDPQATSPAGKMTFSATFEGNETKTSLGDENAVIWDAEDAITVFDVSQAPTNSKCILSAGDGTSAGTFTGDVVSSEKGYFALYPYTESLVTLDCSSSEHPEGILKFRGMDYSIQYARKGNIPSNIPMVAYADAPEQGATVALDFKNVFSYLKFTIEYKCKSVTISSNSGNALTQSDYSISFDSDGLPVVSTGLSAVSTVTLKNEDGSAMEPGTYYAAVFPQTLGEGFSMTFTSLFDEINTTSVASNKSVTLQRGHILDLGKIDLSSIVSLFGSGTSDDPYLISDYLDLEVMQMWVYNNVGNSTTAYYKQTNDIDCENQTLDPIGGCGTNYFSGTYDGGEHTISNIKYGSCDVDHENRSALFARIKDATIQNLNICNPSFTLEKELTNTFSPLVAVALSEDKVNGISNCHVTSKEFIHISDCDGIDYGGIVAINESELAIQNCSSDIDLDFKSISAEPGIFGTGFVVRLGGIVGFTAGANKSSADPDGGADNARTYINCCRNSGSIYYEELSSGIIKEVSVGGILGKASDTLVGGDVCCIISSCVNSGTIFLTNADTIDHNYIGGIVGQMDSDGYNSNDPRLFACLNKGSLISDYASKTYAGGIMGLCYDEDTSVESCVNMGETSIEGAYSMYYCKADRSCTSCYTTLSWDNNGGCTVKSDLSSDTMNSQCAGLVNWVGNASDNTLDIKF